VRVREFNSWYLNLPRPARPFIAVLMVSLSAGFLLILLSASGPLIDALRGGDEREERISRLLGYMAAEEQLKAYLEDINSARSELTFLPKASNQAGAEMQELLRSQAESSGLAVVGSQLSAVVEAEDESSHGILEVELTLRGSADGLDQFLDLVASHRPLLKVKKLLVTAKTVGYSGRNTVPDPIGYLEVRATVSALRQR